MKSCLKKSYTDNALGEQAARSVDISLPFKGYNKNSQAESESHRSEVLYRDKSSVEWYTK